MSDDRTHRPGSSPPPPQAGGELDDARVESLLEGLVELTPAEAPGDAFRQRLRTQFATGSVPPGRFDTVADSSGWRSVWPAVVAAAAVFILVLAANVANRGPVWHTLGYEGDGLVEVNGTGYPPRRLVSEPGLLRPGSVIRVSAEMTLDLSIPDLYVLQAAPGSEFTLPNSPGRWVQRTSHFEVLAGEVRVTTGDQFPGYRILVKGPDAEVAILGTTIAVIARPDGTCLCVLEGDAMMTATGGKPVLVPQGMRRVIWRDATREPEQVPIDGGERMKLQMLKDAHAPD